MNKKRLTFVERTVIVSNKIRDTRYNPARQIITIDAIVQLWPEQLVGNAGQCNIIFMLSIR